MIHGPLNVKFANRPICRYTTFHQNRTVNIESTDVYTSTSLSKLCLSLNQFHETHSCWTELREDLWYPLSRKSVKKYGNFGWKFF